PATSGIYSSMIVRCFTFTPNPATSAIIFIFFTFSTSGAFAGIYMFWLKGHSPSPYLTDHYEPIAVNIGSIARDFTSSLPTPGGTLLTVATTGATATVTGTFSTPNNNGTAFAGQVHLALQDEPAS